MISSVIPRVAKRSRGTALLLSLILTACTNGGIAPSTGGGGSGTVTTINVSLGASGPLSAFGQLGGYTPAQTTVAVGTGIQFVNIDNAAHTASMVAGTTFPSGSPLTSTSTSQSPSLQLSQIWSTGTIAPGASSAIFTADRAGTYLYACFFHYGAPMHGVIIAR